MLKLLKAVKEQPEKMFDMNVFGEVRQDAVGAECGTACCALGSYAARRDLQKVCSLVRRAEWHDVLDVVNDKTKDKNFLAGPGMFDITQDESDKLFNPTQSNQTKKQVIRNIERFITKKIAQQVKNA
jgi:hypothetical protein